LDKRWLRARIACPNNIEEDDGDDLDKAVMDMGPSSGQIEDVLQTEE
jgi:hypothetical protein